MRWKINIIAQNQAGQSINKIIIVIIIIIIIIMIIIIIIIIIIIGNVTRPATLQSNYKTVAGVIEHNLLFKHWVDFFNKISNI